MADEPDDRRRPLDHRARDRGDLLLAVEKPGQRLRLLADLREEQLPRHPALLSEPLARRRVEDVRLGRVRLQRHPLPLRRQPAGLGTRDEPGLLAGDLCRAEDERVGAVLLDDLDAGRAAFVAELEGLGPETSAPPSETLPFVDMGTVQRFIAGEPMKPATNVFVGWSYSRRGVSTCWRNPSLSAATRWPSVIASAWSCVT